MTWTLQNLWEYEFWLICIFPYKDRIYDSLLIRENKVRKNRILAFFTQWNLLSINVKVYESRYIAYFATSSSKRETTQ